MAPRITVPLFITCQRAACGAVVQVKNRTVQRIRRYCTRHCARKDTHCHNFTKEAQSRGGKMRASRMRAALMLKIGHLNAVDAFRLGYQRGLQSKWRQTRNRKKAA